MANTSSAATVNIAWLDPATATTLLDEGHLDPRVAVGPSWVADVTIEVLRAAGVTQELDAVLAEAECTGIVTARLVVADAIDPDMAEPGGRYAAYLAEALERRSVNEYEMPADIARYLLIENAVDGDSTHLSTHQTLKVAGRYHLDQEYRHDWEIEILIDLDTGDRYRPQFAVEFVPEAD